MLIDLIKEFQYYAPGLASAMRDCSHHYSPTHINPFHIEGDTWTHTCLAYNELRRLKLDNPTMNLLAGITVLGHDIGKIYTRHSPSPGKIAMYNHAFASIQDTFEFVKHLDCQGYFINCELSLNQILHYVLTAISNHMDFLNNRKLNLEKCNFDPNLLSLSKILVYCDINGSINQDEEIQEPPTTIYGDSGWFISNSSCNSDIILFCGPPASGKDYLATEMSIYSRDVISYDDIRVNMYQEKYGIDEEKTYNEQYNEAFHYCNEHKINLTPYLIKKIEKIVENGKQAIICNTNLTRKSRRSIINSIKNNKVLKYKTISAKYVLCEREELYKRDELRSKTVGNRVIDKFIYNQQIPTRDEGFEEINFIAN